MIWFVFIYITEKKFGSASGKIIKQKQSVWEDMLRINTYIYKNYILISRNFMLVRLTSWIRASPTNYNYTHVRLKKWYSYKCNFE